MGEQRRGVCCVSVNQLHFSLRHHIANILHFLKSKMNENDGKPLIEVRKIGTTVRAAICS